MELWKELEFEIKHCSKCNLHFNRKIPVVGEGNINTPIMFVGEAPGEKEDVVGKPFVGKSGGLFTKIFNSVDLAREDVYITNIVKCHPKGNRNPEEDEIKICSQYLETQIALINPKIIVTVGSISTKWFLKEKAEVGITKLRGKIFDWEGDIKVIPIFHPSYLIRNQSTSQGSPKWNTWQDMKLIKMEYEKLKN